MKIPKIFILLVLISAINAQDNDITFEHFSTKDGITQNYITAIVQDSLGYIWFSTQFGLNKFDGYNFTSYLYDPKNKNSPRGNWMNFLTTDNEGKIWIFQGIGGIDCFDTYKENFTHYYYDVNDPNGISEKFINTAHIDQWGNFWLGMFNTGINRFDRENKTFKKYSYDLRNDSSVSSNQVFDIASGEHNGNKYIWISTGSFGFNQLNIETGQVKRFKWRNFRADEKLYAIVDSKISTSKEIAAIRNAGDNIKKKKSFSLNKKTKVLVVCEGEGYYSNNYDFGGISKSGKNIWNADPQKSMHAGGELRNRIQFDILDLDEGLYSLNFQTDSTHSDDKWYRKPPDRPGWWGIAVYSINDEEVLELNHVLDSLNNISSLNSNRVSKIVKSDNNLWIATWGGGLNKFSLNTGEFENFKDNNTGAGSALNFLRSIKNDSKGRLWIVDRDNHLQCFDTRSETFINLNSRKYNFANVAVNRILEDKKGCIWVGTQKSGLYKIEFASPVETLIKNYRHDSLNPKSISGNSISFLLQDKSENIWVGTNGKGINKFNDEKNRFNLITENKNTGTYLSDRFVSSFAEDSENNIWIATRNGGLNKFMRKENTIKRNIPGLSDKKFTNLYSIFVDGNFLYLGLNAGGVYKYNIRNHNVRKIKINEFSNNFYSSPVSSITKSSDGYLWVGTFNSGAYRINESTGEIIRYLNNAADSSSLLSNAVWRIYEDSNSDIWIGSAGGGISKFLKDTGKFKNYDDKGIDPYRFPNQSVECFYEDSKGNFWIGSFSAGLNLLNRATDEFKYFTVKDGLPGNRIDGIVEDSSGNLWLSTNNGICKFNYETMSFRNYDYTDGLQDNEFARGSYLIAENGEIFFGGEHGFNYFFPENIIDSKVLPKINLTAFKKYNEEINFDKAVEKVDLIELAYNEDEISFEFVALDYIAPSKIKYAYKMDGFDKDWIYSGKRRYANYTNLDPGSYVFHVIGTNSDGIWNKKGASINLIVYPPFWETWWFYLLSSLLLVSSVFSAHRIIVRKKVAQTLEHERIRTSEREKVREELSRDFHDELGHKLTRISMYTRNLKKKSNNSESELMRELKKVNETSQSLYLGAKDLIWALNPGEDTLYDAVIRLKDFGDDLFDKSGINFSAKGINDDYKSVRLPMEWKRHLVLIFKESMNNILKYAECKNVLFKVESINGNLKILLSDDGKGFEINTESNGYGLNNIKKRAEKIKGEIQIISECEKGTQIIFTSNIPQLSD